jgi:uncharacterized membrane protein (UPF0127 family)
MLPAHELRVIPLALLVALIIFMVSMMIAPVATEPVNYSQSVGGTVTLQGPSGPVSLGVELATTPEQHSQGLMDRESLPEGEGMLFIFGSDQPRSFWMKNTLIPLDMIFINSSLEIVSIIEDAQPCGPSRCPLQNSGLPSMYVLEANAGFVQEHGLSPGQGVDISLF